MVSLSLHLNSVLLTQVHLNSSHVTCCSLQSVFLCGSCVCHDQFPPHDHFRAQGQTHIQSSVTCCLSHMHQLTRWKLASNTVSELIHAPLYLFQVPSWIFVLTFSRDELWPVFHKKPLLSPRCFGHGACHSHRRKVQYHPFYVTTHVICLQYLTSHSPAFTMVDCFTTAFMWRNQTQQKTIQVESHL